MVTIERNKSRIRLSLVNQYFEGGKYMPSNVIVGKEGLYISTSHPNYPELLEDRMVFERFYLKVK